MDPSALIFVALAVAWAVYLVPKALRQHDEAVRSRSVERFSHTMRVLARREPVDRRNARLVVTPGRPASTAVVTTKPASARPDVAPVAEATPAQLRTRREAANRAARRRRRVLGTILLANVAVLALAAFSVIAWGYAAIPAGLLVAWLVACRLMVRQERAVRFPVARTRPASSVPAADAEVEGEVAEGDDWTADTSSMPAAIVDPTLWDPVPVTLPTYVTKPAATRRTVRTIDLDDTGVWTSGNTYADSQLAREAEEADRARKSHAQDADQRAVGS
ncbi:hypothetical protein GCM10009844_22860 [Nocardioides koreensis]|uniref:Uncharacterized protein n=1 Tax=Nocardioides koreensis TaxID=433651 RepID=A0ABP5LG45_9ACTN